MKEQGQIKIIYKKSLYEELLKLGYQPIAIEKNYKNNKFFVYKFIKTKEFAKDLAKLFGNKG
jgi:hypothetical protein